MTMDPIAAAGRAADLAAAHGIVGVLCLVIVGLVAAVAVLWRRADRETQARTDAQAEHYRQMIAELERKADVERELTNAIAGISRLLESHMHGGNNVSASP